MLIRSLVLSDLPQVLRIEHESFPAPWSAAMFALELTRADSLCFVGEAEGEIVGYVVCSQLDLDWHLMNIAVPPSCRGKGIAKELMTSLLSQLGNEVRMTLEVRPSNEAAIALYQFFGFMLAGRRIRYSADTGEDALIMWRTEATLKGSLEDVPNADGGAR